VKTDAETVVLLEQNKSLITSLGRIEALTVSTDAAKPDNSAVTIAENLEIYIPLAGLIDYDAERAKLAGQRDKKASELERLTRKLSNEGFLAKAAPEIIAKDRAAADELSHALALIATQLKELG
jgi:valyl-tRNA synthetase